MDVEFAKGTIRILSEEKLLRTCQLIEKAIPDCLVTGFEPLIEGLTLPDPDDRHVLAAAICCRRSSL